MAEKLELDSEVHDLVLGRSFDRSAPVAFHSLRYDFKSASADSSQAACVDVGDGNSVTVQIPHLEGSGTSHTLYKGNKRPTQKECVLIIDHDTGQITLERLATNVQLKKARNRGTQNKKNGVSESEGICKKGNSKTPVRIGWTSAHLSESITANGTAITHSHSIRQKSTAKLRTALQRSSSVQTLATERSQCNLVSFARSLKDDLAVYLNSLKGYTSRRPYVTSTYGLAQLQAEYPELYAKAARRTTMADSDIDDINSFLCNELGKYFLGVDVYNRLQLLEDATDFILDKYQERSKLKST